MGHNFFLFSLGGHRYALHLQAVEKVIPAVEITPLPDSIDFLLGIINVQGRILPVMDIRKKFGLQERALGIDDKMVIVRVKTWAVAFVVDSVEGVIERPLQEITPSGDIMPGLECTEGVVKIDGDMSLIYDIGEALSFQEQDTLQAVLAQG